MTSPQKSWPSPPDRQPSGARAADPAPSTEVRTARCTVSVCDGVRGELVNAGGRWRVGNESEIRTLMALGGDERSLGLLNMLARTLEGGLIQISDLQLLSNRLEWLFEFSRDIAGNFLSDDGLDQAVLFACAHSDEPEYRRLLGLTLLRRLAPNAVNGTLWTDYLGDVHWSSGGNFPPPSQWHDESAADLLSKMPRSFWSVLQTHADGWLREMAVVTDPQLSASRLKWLATDNRREILTAVALHPNASARTHRALLKRAERSHLEAALSGLAPAIASNRSATRHTLAMLSKCGQESRYLVAMHPNVTAEMLVDLLTAAVADGDVLTTLAVASNPRSPQETLRFLADVGDTEVSAAVAANRALPYDLISSLFSHRHRSVRAACASNPSVPIERAQERCSDRSLQVRAALAERPDLPPDVLKRLAVDPKTRVREAVAANRSTPGAVLRALASDGEASVRREVAASAQTPADVLTQMISDPSVHTRIRLADNESASLGILAALADDTGIVKQNLAHNRSADVSTLTRLASDDSWVVRAAVARNPSAPAALLERLGGDEAVCVRHAAHRNLRRGGRGRSRPEPRPG